MKKKIPNKKVTLGIYANLRILPIFKKTISTGKEVRQEL